MKLKYRVKTFYEVDIQAQMLTFSKLFTCELFCLQLLIIFHQADTTSGTGKDKPAAANYQTPDAFEGETH